MLCAHQRGTLTCNSRGFGELLLSCNFITGGPVTEHTRTPSVRQQGQGSAPRPQMALLYSAQKQRLLEGRILPRQGRHSASADEAFPRAEARSATDAVYIQEQNSTPPLQT